MPVPPSVHPLPIPRGRCATLRVCPFPFACHTFLLGTLQICSRFKRPGAPNAPPSSRPSRVHKRSPPAPDVGWAAPLPLLSPPTPLPATSPHPYPCLIPVISVRRVCVCELTGDWRRLASLRPRVDVASSRLYSSANSSSINSNSHVRRRFGFDFVAALRCSSRGLPRRVRPQATLESRQSSPDRRPVYPSLNLFLSGSCTLYPPSGPLHLCSRISVRSAMLLTRRACCGRDTRRCARCGTVAFFLRTFTHAIYRISGYMLQFYGTLFKISMLDGWLVVFTGPKLIDELRRASDDELSAVEGTTQVRPSPPVSHGERFICHPSRPRCRHPPRQTTTPIAIRSADRLSLVCRPAHAYTHTHTHTG